MIINTFKKGDWFIMWGKIYKIYESGMFTIFTHEMIQTDNDYEEGDRYMFDSDLVAFSAKKYRPYQEEADEDET